MARYKTIRYVLIPIWDKQWVECEADNFTEAMRKFKKDDNVDVTHSELGESEETIDIQVMLATTKRVEESDNG
jgi:predicted component of type VI protein secretion system